jgi:hypothetical protein
MHLGRPAYIYSHYSDTRVCMYRRLVQRNSDGVFWTFQEYESRFRAQRVKKSITGAHTISEAE